MRRSIVILALAMAATACMDDSGSRQTASQQNDVLAGPAPDAEIVDLPMDSLSNDEMADEAGETPGGQVVESDR